MFMSSIILGIAALVAINSFNYNLVKDIDRQSASLLGADIAISGNRPLKANLQSSIDSIPGEESVEMDIFSMSYIPSNDETQFVRIKAIQGDFPYYGKLKTVPEEAGMTYQNDNSALVDDGLMFEQNLEVGDSIKLGQQMFEITGRLKNAFGSTGIGSSFAPAIYIGKKSLDLTELIQPGSMVDYNYYKKIDENFDADEWKKGRNEMFRNESMRIETVEGQKEDLNEAFSSLNNFLNLVALVSLLLGCIGVASSVLIYVKSKIPSIAVFRCLGMKGKHAFLIYFIQIFGLGCLGVLLGAVLGSVIQVALPVVLKDFLPYEINLSISWRAIIEGIVIGTVITVLFALAPLISVRNISPLRTLRSSLNSDIQTRDPLKYLVYGGIFLSLFGFLWRLTGNPKTGIMFTLGLSIAFLFLYGIALFIMWAVRRFFPRRWSFVFRQGLSNLYRPNNQTRTLLVSIGLGTAVLTTLFIIQGLLLNNVDSMDAGNQPNMILYGIEKNQSEAIHKITKDNNLPIIQSVPIVTMRIAGWQGKTKEEWFADTTRTARRWAINREARVTYRDTLDIEETLTRGTYTGQINPGDSVFISLDEGWAKNLDVDLGDEIVWNVQGALIKTYVGSMREIQFRSMRTRFFVLFPRGVLESAPQFEVLVTKTPDNAATAKYRREVVKAYPNVSAVDLGSILVTLNDILNKVSYIIKFMAAFSILTGLIVLISSLLLSKFQRIKESVLLRTIGASRNQILAINATEYSLLGILSAATGILISLIGSYFLAKYQLELDFTIQWWPIIIVFLFIVGITILIGIFNSREVISKSPLEVLRKEM